MLKDIFRRIYGEYHEYLHQHKLIDFDDMLVYTYELFRERKDILSAWQRKFQYILIDEFQDINKIQFDIVKMLAAPENNLFVVGMMTSPSIVSVGQDRSLCCILKTIIRGRADFTGYQLPFTKRDRGGITPSDRM